MGRFYTLICRSLSKLPHTNIVQIEMNFTDIALQKEEKIVVIVFKRKTRFAFYYLLPGGICNFLENFIRLFASPSESTMKLKTTVEHHLFIHSPRQRCPSCQRSANLRK